jgi:hypothetical protein
MSPNIQNLVNAQIEISRAVFEANKDKPRAEYIRQRILQAQIELSAALKHKQYDNTKNRTKG